MSFTNINLKCGVCTREWQEQIPARITMQLFLDTIRSIRCTCCADYHAINVAAPAKQERIAA